LARTSRTVFAGFNANLLGEVDDSWAVVIGDFLAALSDTERTALIATTPLLRRLSTIVLDGGRP
jgi:hypothetical protein